jgi:hypothetical protein
MCGNVQECGCGWLCRDYLKVKTFVLDQSIARSARGNSARGNIMGNAHNLPLGEHPSDYLRIGAPPSNLPLSRRLHLLRKEKEQLESMLQVYSLMLEFPNATFILANDRNNVSQEELPRVVLGLQNGIAKVTDEIDQIKHLRHQAWERRNVKNCRASNQGVKKR